MQNVINQDMSDVHCTSSLLFSLPFLVLGFVYRDPSCFRLDGAVAVLFVPVSGDIQSVPFFNFCQVFR